jgi:hypothetical protein
MIGWAILLATLSCSPVAGPTGQESANVGSATDAWLVEDFSSYDSLEDFLKTDEDGRYHTTGNHNDRMSLDLENAFATNRHSLRYDFPDRSSDENRCKGYTISREFHFPTRQRENWVEAWIKFSENFSTRAPDDWACDSNPDMKLLFGLVAAEGGSGRFQIKTGVFGKLWSSSGPNGRAHKNLTESEPFWDGEWHQIRTHWRAGNDGALRVWLDGILYQDTTGVSFEVPDIYGLKLGANRNQGPNVAMSYWWGQITVWNRRPDWHQST